MAALQSPSFDVSVLIAVRNEAHHLAMTLQELREQISTDVSMEVLVIDGMSTDETVEIAKSYIHKLPNLRVLQNPKVLSAAGWNIGLINAKAPVVMLLSGHAKLPKSYFQRLLPQLHPERAGAGGVAVPVGVDARSSLIAAAFTSPLGNGGASFMQAKEPSFVETIAFGCYWRSILQVLGGFDETIVRGQDWDLNLRLRKASQTLWLDPSLRIEYATRNDYRALWKRQFLAGYWKPYIHWKNTAPFLLRHWIPSLFAAVIVSLVLLGLAWHAAWIACAALVGLHMLASAWSSRRLGFKLVERVQFWWATWIIHFAYGVGFWGGVVKCLKMAIQR
jgi:succinoglycan biosynthesis protein ExoA